ncbi:MAG TPA: GWxTD domain-containing protein, partial [Bryobacteraceae bacterium]|nr:GWxTD domain-containing protein [Bryobacteraceae bacterium]
MNTLLDWTALPWIQTLAGALAHFLWQGALIAMLLAAARRLTRQASARLRYALACMAMAGMLLSFASTLVLLRPQDRTIRAISVPSSAPAAASSSIAAPAIPPAPDRADFLRWIVPVWMAGVLVFYGRTARNWIAAQRLRRRAAFPAPEIWQERLRTLCGRLRLATPVVLLESWLAEVPVVIGFLRPVILVPAGLFSGLPPEQLEAILIHELEHIRRHDYLINVLESLVEGLFFYHPAVWWVSRTVRAEREHCCDDRAAALVGSAWAYASALAALEQSRSAGDAVLAATGGDLLQRIRRLVEPRREPEARGSLLAAGLVLLSGILAALLWLGPPAAPVLRAQNQAQPQQTGLTGPYQKWLDEDVVYIISDAERAEFLSLPTNDAREEFIRRFWEKRDPTPGTPENEFKKEHYRRIAHANQHYAAGISGWRTDRGRIYIQYGPPDEIESHPSGDSYQRPPEQGGGVTSTYPFEQWLYHYIQGIGKDVMFEFVDSNRKGEYRLIPPP